MTHSLLLIETSMAGTYDLRPKLERINIEEAKTKDWYQTFVREPKYTENLPKGNEDIYELCSLDLYINGEPHKPIITMFSLFNRSTPEVRRVRTVVNNNVGNLKFLIAALQLEKLKITETNISDEDLEECYFSSDGTNFVYNSELIRFTLAESREQMIACALKISILQKKIAGLSRAAHQHVAHAAAATQSFRPTDQTSSSLAADAVPQSFRLTDQTPSSRAAAATAPSLWSPSPQSPAQKRADNPAAHHARAAAASSSQDATVFRFASLSGAAAAAASSRAASSHPLRAAETSSSTAATVFRPTSFSSAAAAAASSEAAASAAAHPTHPTHLFVQSRPAEGLIFE